MPRRAFNDLAQGAPMVGYFVIGYLASVAVMSFFTFIAFGYDKRQARLDRSRLSEKSLHVCSLLGGWPGALLGQRVFRHKTAKTSFLIVFWITILLNVASAAGGIYVLWGSAA